MTGAFPYASPAALRAALTDRLKKLATSSPFTMTDLQRQFAYDRLLARVSVEDSVAGGARLVVAFRGVSAPMFGSALPDWSIR